MGVTRRFPIPKVGREAKAAPYDFARLDEGHGLYVFSYEITCVRPHHIEASTTRGIRIWEHRFLPDSADTIIKLGLIPVKRNFDEPTPMGNFNDPVVMYGTIAFSLISVFSDHGGPRFEMRYEKGRVVYGGHVQVDASTPYVRITVESRFDEDIGPIRDHFKEAMKEVEILIAPMVLVVPEINDSWKD